MRNKDARRIIWNIKGRLLPGINTEDQELSDALEMALEALEQVEIMNIVDSFEDEATDSDYLNAAYENLKGVCKNCPGNTCENCEISELKMTIDSLSERFARVEQASKKSLEEKASTSFLPNKASTSLPKVSTSLPKPKTCYRCQHYHATVEDASNTWHCHDFCDAWMKCIPAELGEDRMDGFDAVDAEIAVCWLFEEKEKENE